MAEQVFKPGDVVMIKSGGPKMTVIKLSPEGQAQCVWYSEGSYSDKWFIGAILKKAEEETKPFSFTKDI